MTLTGDFGNELAELRRRRPHLTLNIARPSRPGPPDLVVGVVRISYLSELGVWGIYQDLSDHLGTGSNYQAEERIMAEVLRVDPALHSRLEFDAEADRCSVSTASEADIRKVAEIINGLASPTSPGRIE